jgi:transcription initiation factor TFIIE subunit beta
MSSYLDTQKSVLKNALASTGGKISAKSAPSGSLTASLAPPSPSPSIGSTTSKNETTPNAKRKRDATAPIYSQPENTGFGNDVLTQMTFAVEYLKKKDEAKAITDILDHLSLVKYNESHKQTLVEQMRRHPRIQWVPDPALSEQTWRSGAYLHRPLIPGVKNKTSLLAYLQRKIDATGVSVKELKDGWPDCEESLAELEREHRILVVRTKKDNHPRMVWINDPSLCNDLEQEFKIMWHRVQVPSIDDIVRKLSAVGQKPTSEDPRLKAANLPKAKQQKKRAQRRPGKSTNTHMEHLLKDYGHLKR